MRLRRTLPAIFVVTLVAFSVQAQQLFRLDFHGHARFLNSRGHVVTRSIGARDLIATCVGTNALGTNRDYALVYDPSSDMVEVASATNGTIFCQLFAFQGGMTNSDGLSLDRFNYVFTPGETNAAGTAVIRERIKHGDNRISIQGQLQFVMASIAPDSAGSNSTGLGVSSTNVITFVNTGASSSLAETNTSVSSTALTVPGLPSSGTDTSVLTTTNVAAAATPVTPDTNTDLALPGLPGSSTSIVTTTNAADLTSLGTDSGALAASNSTSPPAVPGSSSVSSPTVTVTNNPSVTLPSPAITNSTSEVAASLTNQVSFFSFTNGVIVFGNFTGGKNVVTNSTP